MYGKAGSTPEIVECHQSSYKPPFYAHTVALTEDTLTVSDDIDKRTSCLSCLDYLKL